MVPAPHPRDRDHRRGVRPYLRRVPKSDREISRPSCVPTDRASDLKIPLPTTCSTTDASSLGFPRPPEPRAAAFSAFAARCASASLRACASASWAVSFSYADSRSTAFA